MGGLHSFTDQNTDVNVDCDTHVHVDADADMDSDTHANADNSANAHTDTCGEPFDRVYPELVEELRAGSFDGRTANVYAGGNRHSRDGRRTPLCPGLRRQRH
jgi:hypothetical protein